jgi:hypothetical protein
MKNKPSVNFPHLSSHHEMKLPRQNVEAKELLYLCNLTECQFLFIYQLIMS